jgi:CheY-like chemotaxis protein
VRILVVEDDHKVASFIQSGLTQEGYAVDVLRDGTMAGEQARAVDYDAVILDVMLPGRSGFEVLRDIRARKPSLPVVILTAKDALDDRIVGLDSGADDYMVKPFALAELSARLRAVLRRGAPRDPLMVVLFGFLTCGIYLWYWLYTVSTEIKNALGREDINPTMDVVLSLVTCGIYFIYLLYKCPQLMLEMQDRSGKPRNDVSMTALLLGIFGLGIVSVAIIQSELNAIWEAARRG